MRFATLSLILVALAAGCSDNKPVPPETLDQVPNRSDTLTAMPLEALDADDCLRAAKVFGNTSACVLDPSCAGKPNCTKYVPNTQCQAQLQTARDAQCEWAAEIDTLLFACALESGRGDACGEVSIAPDQIVN